MLYDITYIIIILQIVSIYSTVTLYAVVPKRKLEAVLDSSVAEKQSEK